MPDIPSADRVRGRRPPFAIILIGLSAAVLGGCAGGDLGRTRASALNDDMHRWIGAEAVNSIGRRASEFQLTDNERQLRDLAYPFIEPPHSRPAWKSVFGDYAPMPAPWRQEIRFDRTAYGRRLIDEPHRSHASRYAQLMEDVRDDLTRLDPFFTTAAVVADLDGKRKASLTLVSGLSAPEYSDAIARMKENRLIVEWVQQCLRQRVASYRWALERLVIHAPDDIAADADRLISQLAGRSAPAVASPAEGSVVVSKG
ncbi:hypothetical protein [Bradyrhizobium sp. LHD-71]|uniref:hypothetical protein n=1 Tax=Bradyrhizobium sp. LHD-71 TaxID=3072141 RepID=UPI00280F4E60|nr:hypothetical protein [Bradyrhizobium sp. LHD-71]MDQ8728564.1 hypothetical protein [Bradyrhizobium sp. LHD-71]